MSLLKVNTIESLSGPSGIINITGEIVVNGIPISGTAGPTGATGVAGATGSGGISGSTVVYVSADSDPATNGAALKAAYTEAKALAKTTISSFTWEWEFYGSGTGVYIDYDSFLRRSLAQLYYDAGSNPVSCTVNGSPAWYTWDGMSLQISSTIDMMTPIEAGTYPVITDIITYTYSTLIVAPGYYQTVDTFQIDGDRVNVTSLSGEADVFIYSPKPSTMMGGIYPWVNITAQHIIVTGISTVLSLYDSNDGDENGNGQIRIGDNLSELIMKNCEGGSYSFGGSPYGSGTGVITINGTFINCKVVGYYGFGYSGDTLSGTFIDCKCDAYGFGSSGCTLSGKFINCSSTSSAAFGSSSGYVSGSFYNCTSGDYGFGSGGSVTGEFYNCISGIGSWVSCYNSNFYNCVGGQSSWSSTLQGASLYHCTIKTGSNSFFATVTSGGKTRYCVDGYGMTNNQG